MKEVLGCWRWVKSFCSFFPNNTWLFNTERANLRLLTWPQYMWKCIMCVLQIFFPGHFQCSPLFSRVQSNNILLYFRYQETLAWKRKVAFFTMIWTQAWPQCDWKIIQVTHSQRCVLLIWVLNWLKNTHNASIGSCNLSAGERKDKTSDCRTFCSHTEWKGITGNIFFKS